MVLIIGFLAYNKSLIAILNDIVSFYSVSVGWIGGYSKVSYFSSFKA
jgi:hypothetical protein